MGHNQEAKVARINPKKIFKKSNALVEARSKLSLAEKKLLACMVAQIDSKKPTNNLCMYIFDVRELAEQIGYTNPSDGYKEIAQVVDKLQGRRLKFHDSERNLDIICRWVAGATFLRDEGIVRVGFYPDLVPVLLDYQDFFTKFQLSQMLQFRSKYAFSLYELLKQYEKIKKRIIEIDELREILGLDDGEYQQWNDFRRRVLDVAKKEINKSTDIEIAYTPRKRGRKYHSIEFRIRKNRKKSAPKKPVSTPDTAAAEEKLKKWRIATRKKFAKLSPEVQEKWINAARKKSGPDLLGLLGTNDQPGPILIQTAAELWAENAN